MRLCTEDGRKDQHGGHHEHKGAGKGQDCGNQAVGQGREHAAGKYVKADEDKGG